MNLQRDQAIRSIVVYALSAARLAWRHLRSALLVAGVATLSAFAGVVIPHSQSAEPAFIEGLFAYFKLSAVAMAIYLGVSGGP